jgi:hypothetical protein
MRSFLRTIALAAFALWASQANALPITAMPVGSGITEVQLHCTPASCIDQRTGVYTQSTCDRRGCRPFGGPVHRAPPPPPPPQWGGGYRGGGFDCNHLRCIDGNGRVWESTCDYRGCRPLQPARRPRW